MTCSVSSRLTLGKNRIGPESRVKLGQPLTAHVSLPRAPRTLHLLQLFFVLCCITYVDSYIMPPFNHVHILTETVNI